jgi:type II restriction enzyme
MPLVFDTIDAEGYNSRSQQVRQMSERWLVSHVYCPACGQYTLERAKNNQKVCDAICSDCGETFELKSRERKILQSTTLLPEKIPAKILGGAYHTMLEKAETGQIANLMFLQYKSKIYEVSSLIAVPRQFIVPSIIEKRRPLKSTARRSGWVGCNILLERKGLRAEILTGPLARAFQDTHAGPSYCALFSAYALIPSAGQLQVVVNGELLPAQAVSRQFQSTVFLHQSSAVARSWLVETIGCIEKIGKKEFHIQEVYQFEEILQNIYKENHNIRAKLRQQLQILRNQGYLEFLGRGHYRLCS